MRGLRYALWGLIGVVVFFALLSLPPGAPLRNPQTGVLIGNSPFMNGLIGLIMALFLVTGIAFGIGAKTVGSADDVIRAMTKAVSGLGGTILLFVVISQFVDYFNYSNIPTLMAVSMADMLKSANIGALWLLIGFIVVVMILDLFFTPAIAKWAIFAPVFVPLFVTLSVDPDSSAGGLPHWRFARQFDHATQRLFRAGGRLCPEIRQQGRRRHGCGDDAALCDLHQRRLDHSFRDLVSARSALGHIAEAVPPMARRQGV